MGENSIESSHLLLTVQVLTEDNVHDVRTCAYTLSEPIFPEDTEKKEYLIFLSRHEVRRANIFLEETVAVGRYSII